MSTEQEKTVEASEKQIAELKDQKAQQDNFIMALLSRISELENELGTMRVNMDNLEDEFEHQNDYIVKNDALVVYHQKLEKTLRGVQTNLKAQLMQASQTANDCARANDKLQLEVDTLEAMVQEGQEKIAKLQFLNGKLTTFVEELQACAAKNIETIGLLGKDRDYWCQQCSHATLPLKHNTSSEFQPAQQPRQSPKLTLCLVALENQQERYTQQRAILLWRLHLAKGKILSPKQLDELVYDQSIIAIQQQTSHYKNLWEVLKQELQDATKQTKKHENDLVDQTEFNTDLMQRIAALTDENAMLRGQLQKVRFNAIYNWQLSETLASERGEQ